MDNEEWIELTPRQVGRPPEAGKVTVALHVPSVGTASLRMNLSRVIGQALGWQEKDKVKLAIERSGKRLRLTKLLQEEGADPLDGYTVGVRGTTFTVSVRVHWLMKRRETVPAETAPHTIAGESLVLDLPGWSHASAEDMACVLPRGAAPAQNPAAAPVVQAAPIQPAPVAKAPSVRKAVTASLAAVTRKPPEPVARALAEPPASPRPPVGPIVTAEGSPEDDEREGKDMLAKGRSVREVAEWLGADMEAVRRWQGEVRKEAEAKAC